MANDNKPQSNPVISQDAGETKAESKKEKNTVEVDASVLETLLQKVADLEKGQKELESTSSQDQIRKIEALRASGKLVKAVKIRRFENKLVTGWKMVKDEVWVADGKLHEEQIFKVFFEDGKDKEVGQIQFTRGCLYESFEVIKEGKTNSGEVEFTVILPDGKELVINNKYVN